MKHVGSTANAKDIATQDQLGGGSSILHLIGSSSTPSVSAGAGAGTSPTISITGTDLAFSVTLTMSASGSTSSTVFTVTFAQEFTTTPIVVVGFGNLATSQMSTSRQPGIDVLTTTQVSLKSSASILAGTYKWSFIVAQ